MGTIRTTWSHGARVCCSASIGLLLAVVMIVATESRAQALPANDAPLHEFRTASGQGWFYTLDPAEAQRAATQFHFAPSATFGALHTSAAPGRTVIHRLRVKNAQSYMLSVAPAEFRAPGFVDEGVFGYLDTAQHPGEQRLLRFSNHGQWRVLSDAPQNIENMRRAGYRVDGSMGWAQP